MKRTRFAAIIISCCLALCACALVGCTQSTTQASSSTSPSAPSSATTSSSAAYDLAPAIGAGDMTVQVRNETGYDVIGIRIKASDATQYSAENSFDGFNFENGTVVDLSFTPAQAATRYDVLLLTSEDSKIAVRDIDLVNTKNIVFHFEEGVGFITYTDADTGEAADNRAEALDAEEDVDMTVSDLETQKG